MPDGSGAQTGDQYEGRSDIQLVNQVTGNAGAAGAGALAELTRRHADAMRKSGDTVRRLTWVIAGLTFVIAVLTIYLVVLALNI